MKKSEDKLTILWVAVVDIAITERSPGRQVSANPNRNYLAHLIENVIKLRIRDIQVQISDVQRSSDKIGTAIRRWIDAGNSILRLSLHLSRHTGNNFTLFKKIFQ